MRAARLAVVGLFVLTALVLASAGVRPRRPVADGRVVTAFHCLSSRSMLKSSVRLSARLYALLYFDSAFDVDEAFRRGLGPEETRNARGLIERVLAAGER